jgi:hypothetical protein
MTFLSRHDTRLLALNTSKCTFMNYYYLDNNVNSGRVC